MPRASANRPPESGPRRPPDYTNRNVKLRLFMLVAALMVVLGIAERARDPETWAWFKNLEEEATPAESKPNARLEPKRLATEDDPLGTFIATGDSPSGAASPANAAAAGAAAPGTTAPGSAAIDPVARAWQQGWKDVFHRLEPDQRTLLFEMLHAAAGHAALAPARREAAATTLQATATLWEDYQAAAFQSIVELKGDDQAIWVDVLRQVNRRFSDEVRPALQSVIDGRPPTEGEELALSDLRHTLVELARSRIEDDTVFRPAEREIWFHELARVREALPDLSQQSVGTVSYLQLFKQPADYRGKVVTVEGTVKLAYRVQAPQNYLGIKQYYVYWLQPTGSPDSVIVVYALAAPPGFPAIKDKDIDAATTKLHEDVRVTGVFYKRWAYLGKDATYTAPLIVASVPQWRPPESLRAEASDLLLTPRGLLTMVGVALAVTMVVCLIAYRLGRRTRRPEPTPAELAALADLKAGPTTEESLRQLEHDARSGRLS